MKASANAQRASAYTPNMETPSGSRRAKRGPFCLALTLLIPPLGLLFLWRNGVFRTRGRMLLTVVATIEMAVIFTIAMPKPELYTSLPVPVVPLAVTPAPKDDVVTALSNKTPCSTVKKMFRPPSRPKNARALRPNRKPS